MDGSGRRRSLRLRSKLAEQISMLSTPKPASFHPDQEFLEDATAAKVCEFTYETEIGHDLPPFRSRVRSRPSRIRMEFEEPKYAGKVVTRKELAEIQGFGLDSDLMSDLSGTEEGQDNLESDDVLDIAKPSAKEVLAVSDSNGDISDQSEEESVVEEEGRAESRGGDMQTMSFFSEKNDVEKGKAAKEQIRLLDGLLEMRIKFQDILSLANRLPSPALMPLFLEEGGPPLMEALNQTHRNVEQLLWTLLDLQSHLLSGTESLPCTDLRNQNGLDINASADEDIASDEEEKRKEEGSMVPVWSRKRKLSSDWPTHRSKDCEAEVERLHSGLRPYRDAVISKWNEKTRLASGRITSKAYMEVDRSILSQIEYVLEDKERLRRRTQLRRSVYHILGEREEEDIEGAEGNSTQESSGRDSHLRNYNEDIFDDDDFYHQLLKELIDRKTSYSESSDPIEMGRQWLDLQRLRMKARKKVDTRASKGRKIRSALCLWSPCCWITVTKAVADLPKQVGVLLSIYYYVLDRDCSRPYMGTVNKSNQIMCQSGSTYSKSCASQNGRIIEQKRYNIHSKLVNFMAPRECGTLSNGSKNDLFSSLFGARLVREGHGALHKTKPVT